WDVIDTPRPSAVDLDDGFFIGEGIMRHAGRKREEASSRQWLGVALIRNVAHAERKRARDNCHDFRLRVGVRGNGIALRELEAKHEQAVFSRVAVEYARFSPRRNRWRSLRPFYILRPKHRVIHALGRRGTAIERCRTPNFAAAQMSSAGIFTLGRPLAFASRSTVLVHADDRASQHEAFGGRP